MSSIYHLGVAWWDLFLLAQLPTSKSARGLVRVSQFVHQHYGGERRRVAVHNTGADLDLLIEQIRTLSPERHGEPGRLPEIRIYASGLGAGRAVCLANQLPELSIASLVVANPLWLTRRPTLPCNVVELRGVVGKGSADAWPDACEAHQRIEPPQRVGVLAEAVEDHETFLQLCAEVARS